jgi:hypothetical protein
VAIVQAIFAAIARSAGKLLNMAFGWATVNLFGKVPQERQKYLSIIAFGSVIWLVVLLGIVFPRLGVFLLSFVPLPEWVNDNVVRLAMLVAAALLPVIVGFVALQLQDEEHRPESKVKGILKGYPYTLAVAIALVMMIVFAPIMRLRAVVKRWTTEHLPIMVEEAGYMEIVGDIEKALSNAGIKVERQPASWMLRLPLKVLTALAGKGTGNLVADNLTMLKRHDLEIILHPSDLAVTGEKQMVARAQAVTVEQLAFTPAYMTWTQEGNELEDQLNGMWHELRDHTGRLAPPRLLEELHRFEEALRDTKLEYDEWSILFREKLLLERALWQRAAGRTGKPQEPADGGGVETGAQQLQRARPGSLVAPLGAASVAGALVFAAGAGLTKLFAPHKDGRQPCDRDARSRGKRRS